MMNSMTPLPRPLFHVGVAGLLLVFPAAAQDAGPEPGSAGGAATAAGQRAASPELERTEDAPGIAWFGRVEDARAEASRTGRPILLMSAAPQCSGAPGMW